jgi:hypothetical protein
MPSSHEKKSEGTMFHLFAGQMQEKTEHPETLNDALDKALERSSNELMVLADFYNEHSRPEKALEIYRTISKIKDDRDRKIA